MRDFRYTHCGISIDGQYTIDGGEVLIEHASIDGKDAMDFIECSYVKGGVLLADRIIEEINSNRFIPNEHALSAADLGIRVGAQ